MDVIFDILLKAKKGGIIIELLDDNIELSFLREDFDDSMIPTIKENKVEIINHLKKYAPKKRVKISKAPFSK